MSGMNKADKIWFDGKFINWDDAQVHILSHVMHYGTAAFEGLRAYKRENGTALFRLRDHYERLFDSAKIYHLTPSYSIEQLMDATQELLKVNNLNESYIRPFIFRGYYNLGVNPLNCPLHVAIAAWEWGKYLGEEGIEKGIRCRVSSWQRVAPNTIPAMAKMAGNYLNSQLMKMEALQDGFDEAIALDSYGYVSEGPGENIFIVRKGTIFTPPTSSSILPGITRHTIFKLARKLGISIKQHVLPRESLYVADEIFFTGTAAEITPVVEVDNIKIADGKRGSITKKLQEEFFGILTGQVVDENDWLTEIKF